jgi:hypothetical protein
MNKADKCVPFKTKGSPINIWCRRSFKDLEDFDLVSTSI